VNIKAPDTTRENIKISAKASIDLCESKHHKPWFEEECLKMADLKKQAKLQWFQGPSKAYQDNLSRREASRHFRNKNREYLKDQINELE
jgi:hypothetical protein